MGCALVRVQPQQLVADHADRPEMARQRHVTSGQSRTSPAVSSERQDKSAVNGEMKTQPCNSSSREADAHLATCSSRDHAPAPTGQVRTAQR